MSLDIALTDSEGNEVVSMNWLRNQYGLIYWAEDNYQYELYHNNYSHAKSIPRQKSLHYVVNHWAYKSSSAVNRPLFLLVVKEYQEVIERLEHSYFFFDTSSFIQFVLPHWHVIPKHYILKNIEVVGETREDTCYLDQRMGFNAEWFKAPCFNLTSPYEKTSILEHYKDWFNELVRFAELLQDKSNKFYCSN